MALQLLRTKEQAPESVADVDAKIAAAQQEIYKIERRLEEIKDISILMDVIDPVTRSERRDLKDDLQDWHAKIARYQGERAEAQIREAVAAHAQRVDTVADIHARLMALEGSADTKAAIAKYQEVTRQSIALRTELANAIRGLHAPMLPTRIDLENPAAPHSLTNAGGEIAALNATIKPILDSTWLHKPEWAR